MCRNVPAKAPTSRVRWCQTAAIVPERGSRPSRTYGQPTPWTHSHLVGDGEVTPGIHQGEFVDRRRRLVDGILQLCSASRSSDTKTTESHLVVVPSATKTYMSDKIPYPFRQNSDFLYLTGFQEPDSILVVDVSADQREPKSVMFVSERDSHSELWDGPCTGPDGAVEFLGVDAAYGTDQFEGYLRSLLKAKSATTLWYDTTASFPKAHQVINRVTEEKNVTLESARLLMQRLRLIKSQAEQELMRRTCRVAAEAMTEVVRASHAGVTEAQLHSKMEFECRIRGAQRLAYPPVVAGGARANIIHYVANDQLVLDGDLVLMDAGGHYI